MSEKNIRHSERQQKPSLKSREQSETNAILAYWEKHDDILKRCEQYQRSMTKDVTPNVIDETIRNIQSCQIDIDTSYDMVRNTSMSAVPSEVRIATDRVKHKLNDLLQTPHQRPSSKHGSKLSIKTTSSRRKLLVEEATRLRVELDEQQRISAARESEIQNQLERTQQQLSACSSTSSRHSEYLRPADNEAAHDITTIVQMLADSLTMNRLPLPEPSVFHGDPLEYSTWKTSFDALIGSKNINAGEKIYYLKKYLGGQAKSTVEGTFYFNTDDAYFRARETLDKRYGDDFTIAEAFRDKLESWPRISPRDSNGLRIYADFLQQCVMAMHNIQGLHILNDCRENQKILSKLPDWLITRWSRIINDYKEHRGRYPLFNEFVDFLNKEANIACDPLTRKLLDKTHLKPNTLRRTTLATSSATHKCDDVKIVNCVFCNKNNHTLHDCRMFIAEKPEDKRDFVKKLGLCYGCLKQGHRSSNCSKKSSCRTCKQSHPTCLHGLYEALYRSNTSNPTKSINQSEQQPTDSTVLKTSKINNTHHIAETTSMAVPVYLSTKQNPKHEILVYALLDTQSDTTFVLEEVADQLKVESKQAELMLSTMTSTSINQCKKYDDLQVRGMNSTIMISLPETYSRHTIPAKRSHIATSETARKWPHLKRIHEELHQLQDCKIGLLIGYTCPQALAPRDFISSPDNVPYAQRTDLGWCVVGMNQATQITKLLESDFKDIVQEEKITSQDDIKFLSMMNKNIRQDNDNFYEMPLPFKTQPALINNKSLAIKRLDSLKNKLSKDKEYHDHYTTFMTDMITRGHAEKVENVNERDCWYIPHHGVYHRKKPGKIRVVFDCSAKYRGTSLNDQLLQGPDMLNSLTGVLCRFRKENIAVMSDIESMFHQFRVAPADREYLRFLWWEHGDISTMPKTFRMKVHLFGAKSSPACANFGLKQVASDNYNQDTADACEYITNDFYVDDGLASFKDVESALTIIADACKIFKKGNIRLHKFVSNSSEVMKSIPESERQADLYEDYMDLDISKEESLERALGIQWCIRTDCFRFKLSLPEKPLTRRGILSTISSIYDPLGCVSPFTLLGKQILQEMCRGNVGWDEPLSECVEKRWSNWLSELPLLATIQIKRCVKPINFGTVITRELHHFSDASLKGYGQCTYLRLVSEHQDIHCSLIFSKARVTPVKYVTIPRLELTAALVSVKVSRMLNQELKYSNIHEYFWTDSKVVLGYIHNDDRRFHTFVANRVQQIRNTTDPAQWSYIGTKENPADYVSRGMHAEEFTSSNWFNGPEFLWNTILPETNTTDNTTVSVNDPEVRQASTHIIGTSDAPLLTRLERFSDWHRAVKAINIIQNAIRRKVDINHVINSTVDDIKETEITIIKMLQRNKFHKEIAVLKGKGTYIDNKHIAKLDPFLDQHGVMRVGGRMHVSLVEYNVKHPILLPKDSYITDLIIKYYHEKVCHQGRGLTISEIKSNGYWIIGCNRMVSSHIFKCVSCRRLRSQTQTQKMSELPSERVDPSPPFTYCGIDCFGPFAVKERRSTIKRYGLLFTCLASRAIHIELLDDMTTDTFINSLRCFIAIRGPLRSIRCDNGSNFVGASHEMKECFKELKADIIKNYLATNHCDFIFNPPHASHMGGVWERHIRTIRSILSAILRKHSDRLNTSALRTFMYEAMAIVNSRPISTQNLYDPTFPDPLTPNNLITMKHKILAPPPGNFVPEDLYSRKRWRRVQQLASEFWTRWSKEYILMLQSRQKWNKPIRNLSKGDIVLIKDEDQIRGHWKLGKIVEASLSKDALVRRAKVLIGDPTLTNDGRRQGKRHILERPIHKLVLILENNC